ncbi:MAG: hypothetical protein JXA25_13770 [Anaerolineales bacterium]|nr:hypothetical protein [Anaerolineales bacterium]
MKTQSKWLMLISLLVIGSLVLAACGTPEEVVETIVVEREGETIYLEVTPTPAPIPQGGTIITSNFSDAVILNPILSNDSSSSQVHDLMFVPLLDEDPFTGEIVGVLATGWDISDDGLEYTFYMRDDVSWSDGTPLTAKDFKFTYEAVASELVETPRKGAMELVDSIEILDDYTVKVTFNSLDCTALQNFVLGLLPSHLYAEDFSDIMDSPENEAPSVVSGPFKFVEWVKDDHVTLAANESYYLGKPNVDGWIMRIFPDASAELAALLAGELDYMEELSAQYVSTVEGRIAGGEPFVLHKAFDDGYVWMAMNSANPDNPQIGWVDENENGLFDEGEPHQEQDPHPILSDVRIRQAIAQSIDITGIVQQVVFGQAIPQTANTLPAIEWAYNNEIEPWPFDQEAAVALLEEAGWVDSDGDGIREKDGMDLHIRLMTNQGNEVRESIVTIVKDNLDSIGFDIELEVIEFGTVVANLVGQTFDMAVVGWTNLGSDPEDTSSWCYRYDEPDAGFSFTSYYNQEVDDLLLEARSIPGCSTEDRGERYKRVQEILHEDVPYVFLYVPIDNSPQHLRMNNYDPGPWDLDWNAETWYLTP